MSRRLPRRTPVMACHRVDAAIGHGRDRRPLRHRSLALVFRRPDTGVPAARTMAGNGAPVNLSLYFSWRVELLQKITKIVRHATVRPVVRTLSPTRPTTASPDHGPTSSGPSSSRGRELVPRPTVIRTFQAPGRAYDGGGPRSGRRSFQILRAFPGGAGVRPVADVSVWPAGGRPQGHRGRWRQGSRISRVEQHLLLPTRRRAGPPPPFATDGWAWSGIVEADRPGGSPGALVAGLATSAEFTGAAGWPGRRRGASVKDNVAGERSVGGGWTTSPVPAPPGPSQDLPVVIRALHGMPGERAVPDASQSTGGVPGEWRERWRRGPRALSAEHPLKLLVRQDAAPPASFGTTRAWPAPGSGDRPGTGRGAGESASVAGRLGRRRNSAQEDTVAGEPSHGPLRYRDEVPDLSEPSGFTRSHTPDMARLRGLHGPAPDLTPVARTLRPALRVHREQALAAVVPAPALQVPTATPQPPATVPIDIDRLDTELWKRFEKRVRIENERRGRG
jgi:hypothetical protein